MINKIPNSESLNQRDDRDYRAWQSLTSEQREISPSSQEARHQSLGKISLGTIRNDTEAESSIRKIKEAFPIRLSEKRAHALKIDQQVDEINELVDDSYDHEYKIEDIRELINNSEFSPEAIVAAFGPSSILDLAEEGDDIENFHLVDFINELAETPPLDCVSWQSDCKSDVMDNLFRFYRSEIPIDVDALVKNSGSSDVLSNLGAVLKLLPDFDMQHFIEEVVEQSPGILTDYSCNFLDYGYDFPVLRIADGLKAKAIDEIKYSPDQDWREFIGDDYIEQLMILQDAYDSYGKIDDNEKAYIRKIMDDITDLMNNLSGEYHEDVRLEPIPEAAVETFNQKAGLYREQIDILRWKQSIIDKKLENVSADFDRAELERAKLELLMEIHQLAASTITSFTPDELSYFRRLYIARDVVYDGTEDMGTLTTFDHPLYGMYCLHVADKRFQESDEFYDYNNRKYEQRLQNEWAKLVAKYPNVFDNIDDEEIKTIVDEIIERVPKDQLTRIANIKNIGYYRQADEMLVELLADVFRLEEVPTISYEIDARFDGQYDYNSNIVRISRTDEGDRYFEDVGVINTLAHEVCHAYQYEEAAQGTEWGKLYKDNFSHYQDNKSDTGFRIYRNQLVEVEARAFGEAFAKLYNECNPKNKTRVTCYTEV